MTGAPAEESGRAAVPERDRILTTKVRVPSIRPGYLTRSRLIDILDDAVSKHLTLVSAPAGFGKTTLLADWAVGADLPVAWLSLDDDDDDPVRFWRYILASLETAGIDTEDPLLAQMMESGGASSEGMAAALIEDLEVVPDELVLVLDDYQSIDSRGVHDGVGFLLDHQPSRLHVVVSSRADPPLPVARMRASDQLAEVRATDLRFTPEESRAFLEDVWELDIDLEAAGSLQNRTEGWAAGLQLAALSLRDRSDPEAFLEDFRGTHRYILDYLTQEVLEAQSADVRDFLIKTSILERLNGPLCDAVSGRTDGQAMLEMLERANLFVIPLDDERAWFRFHRLFRDVLSAHLKKAYPQSISELHHRAAAWCADNGLIDEAIRHALTSEEPTWAAELVESNLNSAFNRGEGATVVKWLALLPDAAARTRPQLEIARAMMAWHVYRLDDMDRSLRNVEAAIENVADGSGPEVPTEGGMVADIGAALSLLRAQNVLVDGNTSQARKHLDVARERIGDDEPGPRFWTDWLLSAADWIDGDMTPAEKQFSEMLDKGRATASPHPLMISCSPLGHIREARGNLADALRTYQEALRYSRETGRFSPFHLAEAHLGMARVLYQRDEIDPALRHVSEGIELARQVVEYLLLGVGLHTLAWIKQAMGDWAGAREAVDESTQLIPDPNVASFYYPGHAGRVKLLLAQGDLSQAQRWIEERGLREQTEVIYNAERSLLLLTRVLIVEGDHTKAMDILDRLAALAQSQGRHGSLVEIQCLKALAMDAIGDRDGALATISQTLVRTAPEGHVRAFVDEGAPMLSLLRHLSRADPNRRSQLPRGIRSHLNRIQRASDVSGDDSGDRTSSGMAAPLTDREFDVLQLMAAGKRNREISNELYIAVDTVKKHVSHILEKLAAGNRTEAVAEAARLGILSGPRLREEN